MKDNATSAKKLAKREAKMAKRDARAATWAQLLLRWAKLAPRESGGGTLLTEPVLVFVGRPGEEFRIFDQDAKRIGSAKCYRDKTSRTHGYHLCTDNGQPIAAIEVSGAYFTGALSATYKVVSAEGTEIATIDDLGRRIRATTRRVVAGQDTLGHLTLPSAFSWKTAARLVDIDGSELARVQAHRGGCIAEIRSSAVGRLRLLAVVASILSEDAPEGGGG